MSKTFRTQGAGVSQTLHEIEDEKIPVYDTKADAEADLANLAEEQIVATKDGGADEQTLIDYVDGRLETTTTEIAMDTFKTGSKAQLYKSGNNVQFRYNAGADPSTYNPIARDTTVLIGTIPEGLRPKQDIHINSNGNAPNNTGIASTLVTIAANGNINVWVFGDNPFSGNWGINVDYNIDGTNSHGMTVNTLKDAKDYTDARAVRKYDYTMTGTDNVYNDIKALCNQLITLGVNTYAGSFLRSGRTHGHYNITVSQASGTITLNGTVVVDNEQGKANSYAVSRVNNDWNIMPVLLNNNIHSTDCNLIVNPGIYNIDVGTANTPYTGCYGILELKGFNPDVPSTGTQWLWQEVLDTSGKKYTRYCINPNTLSPTSAQWSAWKELDVISKIIRVTPAQGTVLNNVEECLRYQLTNADWTFLTNTSPGTTATGQFELSGYYWGNYVATNHGGNYVTITGTIDYGSTGPYTFSAFHDASIPVWRITISGRTIDISNTIVTLDANSCFYMGNLGVLDGRSEVIAVHAWTTDAQGQINGDYLCIPSQNVYNQWYCRVEGWGGGIIPNTVVWVWIRYRNI